MRNPPKQNTKQRNIPMAATDKNMTVSTRLGPAATDSRNRSRCDLIKAAATLNVLRTSGRGLMDVGRAISRNKALVLGDNITSGRRSIMDGDTAVGMRRIVVTAMMGVTGRRRRGRERKRKGSAGRRRKRRDIVVGETVTTSAKVMVIMVIIRDSIAGKATAAMTSTPVLATAAAVAVAEETTSRSRVVNITVTNALTKASAKATSRSSVPPSTAEAVPTALKAMANKATALKATANKATAGQTSLAAHHIIDQGTKASVSEVPRPLAHQVDSEDMTSRRLVNTVVGVVNSLVPARNSEGETRAGVDMVEGVMVVVVAAGKKGRRLLKMSTA